MFAAELASIRRRDTERAITSPQTYLPRSLLDFMTAPGGTRIDNRPELLEISHLFFQSRIAGDIDPVRRLGWDVATQAISTKVLRGSLDRVGGIEPGPAPAFAPQPVAGMAVLAVLHHHEPAFQFLRMAHSACGHRGGGRFKHLFHEHGAIRETPIFAICSDGVRQGINDMDLLRTLTLIGRHRPTPQKLVNGAIVCGYAQIAVRVDHPFRFRIIGRRWYARLPISSQ